MNSLKIILATLVIFASGVVTGGLLVFHTGTRPPFAPDPAASIPAPWLLQRFDFLQRIRANLELSTAQDAKIKGIIHASQQRLRPLWEQIDPQLKDELKSVREQISAELTPPQRVRFNKLLQARGRRPGDQTPAMEDHRQRRFLMPGGGFRQIPPQLLAPGKRPADSSTNEPGVD